MWAAALPRAGAAGKAGGRGGPPGARAARKGDAPGTGSSSAYTLTREGHGAAVFDGLMEDGEEPALDADDAPEIVLRSRELLQRSRDILHSSHALLQRMRDEEERRRSHQAIPEPPPPPD